MCMLTKRTNIMFDEELWKKLTKLADKQQVSVGEIVRTAAREKVDEEEIIAKQRKAILSIRQFRESNKNINRSQDSVALIREMREERTDHLMKLLEGK